MEVTSKIEDSSYKPEGPRREPTLPINIFIEDNDVHTDEIQSTYRKQNDCLLTVLCGLAVLVFFPLGIFSLYYLLKAKKQFHERNIPKAKRYGLYAQFLSLVAILMGMVWIGLVIGLLM